jgi:hypothetical protein
MDYHTLKDFKYNTDFFRSLIKSYAIICRELKPSPTTQNPINKAGDSKVNNMLKPANKPFILYYNHLRR